jgi:hypothetical protein
MLEDVISTRFVVDYEEALSMSSAYANIMPILFIENTKETHLGASLKIFPSVRGKRRDRINKTCGSMMDMDGLDKMTRHV